MSHQEFVTDIPYGGKCVSFEGRYHVSRIYRVTYRSPEGIIFIATGETQGEAEEAVTSSIRRERGI